MLRVVSAISVKRERDNIRLLGYSKTDRGQRFINGVVNINTQHISESRIDEKIIEAVTLLLQAQSNDT